MGSVKGGRPQRAAPPRAREPPLLCAFSQAPRARSPASDTVIQAVFPEAGPFPPAFCKAPATRSPCPGSLGRPWQSKPYFPRCAERFEPGASSPVNRCLRRFLRSLAVAVKVFFPISGQCSEPVQNRAVFWVRRFPKELSSQTKCLYLIPIGATLSMSDRLHFSWDRFPPGGFSHGGGSGRSPVRCAAGILESVGACPAAGTDHQAEIHLAADRLTVNWLFSE